MNEILMPKEGEYAPYYATYISWLEGQDILERMIAQIEEIKHHFGAFGEEKSLLAYAEGKWTPKELLGHIIDTDRIMAFRSLCIARGEQAHLPGYDQDLYVKEGQFNQVPLKVLLDDFEFSRRSIVSLIKILPESALLRKGVANNVEVSARALFAIIPGHAEHHLQILKSRY